MAIDKNRPLMISYRLSIFITMNNNVLSEFFTPQQIAMKLQLNVLTIYSYIRRNKLPAVKLGRTYRVSKIDLNNFLRVNKTSIESNLL